jgi:hypothetical protein
MQQVQVNTTTPTTMIGYKLFRKMKSGALRPLFINKTKDIHAGEWLPAENHPTKGFAVRAGWHVCSAPIAPHLSKKGRVWVKVLIADYQEIKRPLSQGGMWYLANSMMVLEELAVQPA